jgi:Matrixin
VSRTRRHPALLATPLALTLLLALLFALAARPAAAQAASDQAFPVGGAEFERARAIAQGHWGAVPCEGNVAYTWQGLEPLTNARASWSNPTSAWGNAAANFECEVVFNTIAQYDFPMLCTVMTHEIGHLLGHAHDEAPGRLMSAIYTAPLPECSPAGPAPAPATAADASDDEGIAWDVSESKSAKRKTSARKATKTRKAAKRKRCVVRFKAGKRVRRCVVLKQSSARRKPKARAASAERFAAH